MSCVECDCGEDAVGVAFTLLGIIGGVVVTGLAALAILPRVLR